MNISKIQCQNFKGVYLSNSLNPGKQRDLGKYVLNSLNLSGLSRELEKGNKDILIKKGPNNSVIVDTARLDIKRVLDDDYSRWNGRF